MPTQTAMRLIECSTEPVSTGLRIHPKTKHAVVVEPQFYAAPLRAECSLLIDGDGSGLRLLFAAGQVIFGEDGSDTLSFVDPRTGDYTRVQGAGVLPEGEVTIALELEADRARVVVNGEERFTKESIYNKWIAGQVGLGVPKSAQVILQALTVTGNGVTRGHKIRKPAPIDFDGGLIEVLYDHHPQMLAWYTEHLGLKGRSWPGPTDHNADATLFASLKLPDHGQFHLYSVLTRKRLAHWFSERGTVDGNVRFPFQCPDLARTHAYFKEQGIRTSELAVGPEGREYFDFYDPEGTRLTAVSYPEKAEKYPDARITNFAPFRIGVTDLARSALWYKDMLGVKQVEEAEGYVALSSFLWLEQVPADQHQGQVESPTRVYLTCPCRQQFTELHERLAQAGARPSAYMGQPGWGWTAFHAYDPDGNRLNFWSYY